MKTRTVLLAATCAAVICLPFIVSSKDNPAQAKARAAVRQDVAKLETPAGKPAPTVARTTGIGPREDTEEQARARQAVRQQLVLIAQTDQGYRPEQVSGPSQDTEAQSMARQAVRANTSIAVVTVVEDAPLQRKPVARQKGSNPLLDGITPPESPFTEEQQAALAALLEPYRADQISTQDYHRKRAAIIAGT